MDKLRRKIGDAIRNSKKPITGAIAAFITYQAARLGLNLDFIDGVDEPALLAGLVYGAVVKLTGPIFGLPEARTPTVTTDRRGNQRLRR